MARSITRRVDVDTIATLRSPFSPEPPIRNMSRRYWLEGVSILKKTVWPWSTLMSASLRRRLMRRLPVDGRRWIKTQSRIAQPSCAFFDYSVRLSTDDGVP